MNQFVTDGQECSNSGGSGRKDSEGNFWLVGSRLRYFSCGQWTKTHSANTCSLTYPHAKGTAKLRQPSKCWNFGKTGNKANFCNAPRYMDVQNVNLHTRQDVENKGNAGEFTILLGLRVIYLNNFLLALVHFLISIQLYLIQDD
uniref:Uncharacterized protein n=1 Tax=Meloidogyne javanica TaxID=6303 RepID=A0A915LJA7_MELJA